DFFNRVEQISGVRAPRVVLPYRLAHLIAVADEWIGLRLRGAPLHWILDPVVVEMASHYWGLKSIYAATELDYESRDPQLTLRDTVDWLRENHESFRQPD
ncbi:MAG: NAD-dependent epimerase, partial [Gammaproteobacteria bacterium]|nr:NAD-dependent epimerase [Gammaproteobacteria bacterium]